jgi:hypothetical protein
VQQALPVVHAPSIQQPPTHELSRRIASTILSTFTTGTAFTATTAATAGTATTRTIAIALGEWDARFV